MRPSPSVAEAHPHPALTVYGCCRCSSIENDFAVGPSESSGNMRPLENLSSNSRIPPSIRLWYSQGRPSCTASLSLAHTACPGRRPANSVPLRPGNALCVAQSAARCIGNIPGDIPVGQAGCNPAANFLRDNLFSAGPHSHPAQHTDLC